MIVAIASGKGGTGKTTLAVNLAASIPGGARLLDCDVEAPNAHLYLRPRIDASHPVHVAVPEIDSERCTGCGRCAAACAFQAIAALKRKPLVFEELCHGCGGCARVCPRGAIVEKPREIGRVHEGSAATIAWVQGRLGIGETLAPPVVRAVKERIAPDLPTLVDCPPGTSCPVVASLLGADYAVLVAEPSPFGLNDLELAVGTVRLIGIPFGVVVNRADGEDRRIDDYCAGQGIELLARIPERRRYAEACAAGKLAVGIFPEYREQMRGIAERIGLLNERKGS